MDYQARQLLPAVLLFQAQMHKHFLQRYLMQLLMVCGFVQGLFG
jgi:hypothetical protein